MELRETDEGLALVGGGMELRGDFSRMLPRLRGDRLAKELLVRAARVKGGNSAGDDDAHESRRPWAIDMTAGLGEDSLLLAAAGFAVTMYECDPVIAALLRDALRRAAEMPELAEIVSRMELAEGDSVVGLATLADGAVGGSQGAGASAGGVVLEDRPGGAVGVGETADRIIAGEAAGMDGEAPADGIGDAGERTRAAGAAGASGFADGSSGASLPAGILRCPDVVYLDPMFPGRTKSAAVKKKFQLLHHLEAPCANEEELVRAALVARPRKVIIKRPIKGPHLAGIKPAYSLAGKAVRYDVLIPASTRLL